MTPCAASKSWILRPKPDKLVAHGFEAETTKPSWSHISAILPPRSRRVSPLVLNRPITKSLRLYLTWSTTMLTWSTAGSTPSPHVHLLVDVPSVSYPRSVLGPSAPPSKPPYPSFTALSPSAQTRLTFSIAIVCINAPHLQTTSQEKCCTTPHSC
jgi:hypothetical protein